MAGPVVAAAVILPKWSRLPGLTDSKLIPAAKRGELFTKIKKQCLHGIGTASHEEVDEFGLLHATFRAYKRALEDLQKKTKKKKIQIDHLMIDGRDKFFFDIPHTSVIKGDLKIRSISAASVLAKVTRDRLMLEFAQKYPQYGFDFHKGYGTKRHQRALKEHGPSKIHRKSYAPLKSLKWVQKELL